MKRISFLFLLIFLGLLKVSGQNIGINATGAQPDNSAMLDVSSSEKGLLIPRMTTVQREAVVTPATGLLVFDTDALGFYFFDGVNWKTMNAPVAETVNFRYYASTSQGINGNTNTLINFGTPSFLNNATFSNSAFTAPVAGLYHFSTALTIYGNNASSLGLSFSVNGVAQGSPSFYILSAIFQAVSFSDNIVLAAGDVVTVQANTSAQIAVLVGQGSFFTGFKVN